MGEKGSLKNLYKSFRFFLLNQKKKRKEKMLLKKQSKINIKAKDKVKLSFFVVLTGIAGFLSSFFPFSRKEKEEIKEINSFDDLKKTRNIIINIVNTVEKSSDIEKITKCKMELNNIEKVINKTNFISDQVVDVKKDLGKANIKVIEKIEIINTITKTVEKAKILQQEKIEKVNEELKDTKDKVNQIKTKLPEVTNKEELFDLKKELEKLEEKFKKNELKEEDLKKLDQFLLLYNTEEIRMLKVKIEDKIKKIVTEESNEQVPIQIKVNAVVPEILKKEEEKKEQNKETKKEIEKAKEKDKKEQEEKKEIPESSLSSDLRMTTTIISKQIIGMENRVNQARKLVNDKPIFFVRIGSMVSSTLRLCASISPFFFFKNKIVGTFTSALLLDNSIRSLRRGISDNKKNVSYIRTNGLELLLKEHKEIEQRTKEIFDDSLEQLTFFKTDFIHKYGRHINGNIELQNMMNEIFDIEEYIVSKQNEYKKENERIKIKLKRY